MMTLVLKRIGGVWLAGALLTLPCLWAQQITGNISGSVSDSSGARIVGAKVTITNVDRNAVVRSTASDNSGNYAATTLPLGRYRVAAEATGFKRSIAEGIELSVADRLTVNLTLEVGSQTDEVRVEESALQVNLQSSESAYLVSGKEVKELSLNNRNFVQLLSLSPGVSPGTSDQVYVGVTNPFGQSNTVSFAINGLRNSQNNWTIDGADNVDRGSNITLYNYPSIEALREFKVQRGLYTAEFGRAGGGQINVVTASGTSKFHGDAYEFFRNDALAANNFFNNRNRLNVGSDGKAKVPPLRYNDFGWTVGGPVFVPKVYNKDRNKTFFFFSQEFRRVVTYSTLNFFAPTASEKQGIFNVPVCVSYVGGTCQQTSTRVNRIDPTAQAYITDIFSKIPDGAAATNNALALARNTFNSQQEFYRIDHVFNEKYSIFGRFLNDKIPTTEASGLFGQTQLPGVGNTITNAPGRSWVVRLTAAFTPTLLSETGYSYSFGGITSLPAGLSSTSASPNIKVQLPFVSTLARVPTVAFNGGTSVAGYGPYFNVGRNYQVFENLTWIRGKHTLKFGGTYFYYQKRENASGSNNGSFSFSNNGVPAGTPNYKQSWANFLLGTADSFTQASVDLTPDIRAQQVEFYIQDDWRVRPNLTINAGLRYSIFYQPKDERGQLTNFDPKLYNPSNAPRIDPATGLIVAGTGDRLNGIAINGKTSRFGDKVANEDYKNLAPRIGFSWDPAGNGKTAIRGGYGLFFDSILFGIYEQNIFGNPPYVNSVTLVNAPLGNPTSGTPNVSLAPVTIRGTPADYKTPYAQQWSLGVQREIQRGLVLDVSYVGTKGTHLLGIVDINSLRPGQAAAAGLVPATGYIRAGVATQRLNALRPYVGYGPINQVQSRFDSNYHGLQVSAQKRFSGNGLISLAYTWSKNLTNNRSDRSNAPQDAYNIKEGEYGLAQLDRRHVLTISYVYELPFYRNRKDLLGYAVGGWQLSGISQFYTGLPLNVASGLGNDPGGIGFLGPSTAGPRPDQIADPNKNAPHTIQQFFNTAAFREVPLGEFRPGNAGRSTIQGPSVQRWDVSLIKNVNLPGREGFRTQFRAEAFNVFNHTNFQDLNTTLGNSLFGQVTTARDPRILQLALKVFF